MSAYHPVETDCSSLFGDIEFSDEIRNDSLQTELESRVNDLSLFIFHISKHIGRHVTFDVIEDDSRKTFGLNDFFENALIPELREKGLDIINRSNNPDHDISEHLQGIIYQLASSIGNSSIDPISLSNVLLDIGPSHLNKIILNLRIGSIFRKSHDISINKYREIGQFLALLLERNLAEGLGESHLDFAENSRSWALCYAAEALREKGNHSFAEIVDDLNNEKFRSDFFALDGDEANEMKLALALQHPFTFSHEGSYSHKFIKAFCYNGGFPLVLNALDTISNDEQRSFLVQRMLFWFGENRDFCDSPLVISSIINSILDTDISLCLSSILKFNNFPKSVELIEKIISICDPLKRDKVLSLFMNQVKEIYEKNSVSQEFILKALDLVFEYSENRETTYLASKLMVEIKGMAYLYDRVSHTLTPFQRNDFLCQKINECIENRDFNNAISLLLKIENNDSLINKLFFHIVKELATQSDCIPQQIYEFSCNLLSNIRRVTSVRSNFPQTVATIIVEVLIERGKFNAMRDFIEGKTTEAFKEDAFVRVSHQLVVKKRLDEAYEFAQSINNDRKHGMAIFDIIKKHIQLGNKEGAGVLVQVIRSEEIKKKALEFLG